MLKNNIAVCIVQNICISLSVLTHVASSKTKRTNDSQDAELNIQSERHNKKKPKNIHKSISLYLFDKIVFTFSYYNRTAWAGLSVKMLEL